MGPVLGPHARTDRTRDTRDAEPWLPAPEDGRLGGGQRLTPGAPHNDGRHPPRGHPSATPKESNAGPQGRALRGQCWVPTPAPTAPGTHGTRNPDCPPRGRTAGGWTAPDAGRPSQQWKTPPPGDALPPPPQRATPARKGARCGTGAGSTRPHRPHPGHTGRGTLAARSRGRAVGEGTAPDTRRPSQRWKAPPPRRCPSATPTASNAGPQGRTLWGRCWAHTPASTAPGTRGSRNPGCPLRRTGDRERDSA